MFNIIVRIFVTYVSTIALLCCFLDQSGFNVTNWKRNKKSYCIKFFVPIMLIKGMFCWLNITHCCRVLSSFCVCIERRKFASSHFLYIFVQLAFFCFGSNGYLPWKARKRKKATKFILLSTCESKLTVVLHTSI